jgi:hypothetical protein
MNARATQTCHLELSGGRNLIHPLSCELSGTCHEPLPAANVATGETISLFPAEWKRDPRSRYIASGYHDVPWDEPGLIRYCLKSRLEDQSWMSYRKWRARKAAAKAAVDLRRQAVFDRQSNIKRPANSR